MLQLNNLESTTKSRKRVGRGRTRGRYSCRGTNGQKSRSGGKSEIKGFFEGGQMPLSRRLPRRGFTNPFKKQFKLFNLADLEIRFESGQTVDRESLVSKGLLKGKKNLGIKILGVGSLTKNLNVHVDACSASALKAIQSVGGTLQLTGEKNSNGAAKEL